MKVQFSLNSTESVAKVINEQLVGRKLGDLVKITADGSNLVLSISKLGTSTLVFAGTPKNNGIEFNLTSEKIAFAHKPMKEEFKEKLGKAIEQAGGKILQA